MLFDRLPGPSLGGLGGLSGSAVRNSSPRVPKAPFALYDLCRAPQVPFVVVDEYAKAHPEEVNRARERSGRTPLWRAAQSRRYELVRMLLARGAAPLARIKPNESSVLHLAVSGGDMVLTALLLNHIVSTGGDVHAALESRNCHAQTVLHFACVGRRGSPRWNAAPLVWFLLQSGASPSAVDNSGATPFMVAVMTESLESILVMAETLPHQQVPVNVPDNDKDTPLHVAVMNGHNAIAQTLLALGASVDAKNAKGQTPVDLAKKGSEMESILHNWPAGTHSVGFGPGAL